MVSVLGLDVNERAGWLDWSSIHSLRVEKFREFFFFNQNAATASFRTDAIAMNRRSSIDT